MMPFAGGLEGTANGTLLLSALLAVLYGVLVTWPPSLRRSIVKTASVALLAFLAAHQGGPALLVAGLALGALGDAFLSRDGDAAFLGGLASFLASHVAYVALFAAEGGGIGAVTGEGWRIALLAVMAAAVIGLVVKLLPALPGAMRAPVLVYAIAILAMGVTALTLDRPVVILGAVLFMASDGLLAVQRFLVAAASPHHAWQSPLVWGLYYLAQLSIALGFLL